MQKTVLAALLLVSGVAHADRERISVAEVASWCQPFKNAVLNGDEYSMHSTRDSARCFGAFVVIQQLAATTWDVSSTETILKTCIPPEVRMTDLIKVFLRYAEAHPEQGHYKFTDVAVFALQTAYPCPTETKPK